MNLLHRGGSWRFQAFTDCPAIYTSQPPNWFHRLMQRWILGFRWTKE